MGNDTACCKLFNGHDALVLHGPWAIRIPPH